MGKIQDNLYQKSPHFIKFLLLNVKGYLNSRKRYTKSFYTFLEEYQNLWYSDINKINKFQRDQLKQLLYECYHYTEWYQSLMIEQNISPDDIEKDPYTVLAKMPILKKFERKTKVNQLVNTNRALNAIGYTSGTSGSPTVNYLDSESINRSFALWRRFHRTIGVDLKVRQVRFSGRLIVNPVNTEPPFWMYNYFENQLLMSTYHLKENNIDSYIAKLNKFRPKLIDGYPSAIYIISKYINKTNIQLNFNPAAIAVTAETLYDYQRTEIEKAFNCNVYNQYASSEGSPFITECISGNLHLNLDSGVFEFLNENGNKAKLGEIAQLVVTSFTNLKTPLIRYNIEDTVLLHKEDNFICNCGCNMPIIEKLTGREDDILWTEEKGYVGRMDTAYKGLIGIVRSQIIQENAENVTINLIIDDNYNQNIYNDLITNMKNRLGQKIIFKINIVSEIPLGPNGKFDAVKRNFEINL